jgi:hypothetical protein
MGNTLPNRNLAEVGFVPTDEAGVVGNLELPGLSRLTYWAGKITVHRVFKPANPVVLLRLARSSAILSETRIDF